MGKIKKKFERGAATNYVTRNQALRRLQLSLKDFRRLCILKGIYPVEPKHKKKANKGSTAPRTFYIAKDIQFLAHEPIINKFRAYKIFLRKLKRATEKKDRLTSRRILDAKPQFKLDHVVKERYPTFQDSLADLDDCLTMLFLFSTFPKLKVVGEKILRQCRRLSVEFLHYVIHTKSLKKVFVSIKGIYFQADVQGHMVTWVIPHSTAGSYKSPQDVDFKIMATFVEFYVTLMGFVNYKLFQTVGLIYPPKLQGLSSDASSLCLEADADAEIIASLNRDLVNSAGAEALDGENVGDDFLESRADEAGGEAETEEERARRKLLEEEEARDAKLHTLFKGFKVFLGREVNREVLVFLIRGCGGEVSWSPTLAVGATFDEKDPSITHQIVDRPEIRDQVLSRIYLQPQWLFDCVNARMLLPTKDYFPGATLPPHLSPFIEEKEGEYVPPEKKRLQELQSGARSVEEEEVENEKTAKVEGEDEEEEESGDDEDEEEEEEEGESENDADGEDEVEDDDEDDDDDESEDDEDEESEDEAPRLKRPKLEDEAKKIPMTKEERLEKMSVTAAKPKKDNSKEVDFQARNEERKLQEMMIPKKRKRLYEKIVKGKKKRTAGAKRLEEKRKNYEQKQKKVR